MLLFFLGFALALGLLVGAQSIGGSITTGNWKASPDKLQGEDNGT